MARLRAHLRGRPTRAEGASLLSFSALRLDLASRRLTIGDRPVRLTRREFELLALLMKNAGKVMTHRQILTSVWGAAHQDDVEYLRVYIKQLRDKIEDSAADPRYLLNEPGVGYRFVVDEDQNV
jgi:two-component system KDP operon response regulator KdpE